MDVQATAFQLRVWEALRMILVGTTASYSDIAQAIGQLKSVRDRVLVPLIQLLWLYLVRGVVQKNGGLGGYRWGVCRKKAILNFEAKNI